ncbi:MAG: hypothetical protein HC913_09230 [Microscillaceae bacterium]|nr:hypothetical protein [Microscillaceae bacterium]
MSHPEEEDIFQIISVRDSSDCRFAPAPEQRVQALHNGTGLISARLAACFGT